MSANFLNTSHQKISWFADLHAAGRLDLRPPFQRRPVWSTEDKAFLVDSILRGYPVPEVYTQSTEMEGKDAYAVVDGQQRLRTCLEFMSSDSFPIAFDVSRLAPLYSLAETPWFGKRWTELSPEERTRFRAYKFITRDLEGVSEEQVRHMFQRLNQANYVLNSQELRYSMYQGGLLATVEKLIQRDEWEQFAIFTKLQQRRMLDSEYVGELVIGHLHWPQDKKSDIDHYYRQYADGFPFEREVLERFGEVLTLLARLFPEPKMAKTRWYRKSDFYTLFIALSRGRVDLTALTEQELRARLIAFSESINSGSAAASNSPVAIYREAVERAATDRTRRIRREEALLAFLAEEPQVRIPAEVVEETVEDDLFEDVFKDLEYEDRPL